MSHVSCRVPPSHVLCLNKRGVWGLHSEIRAKSAAEAGRLSEIRFPGRAEDVVDLERLADLIEPFGPVGCAAAAALIDRQFQLAQ